MVHHHHSRRIRMVAPIPSSTPQSLVFEYDPINKKFNTTNYQPYLTQNRAAIEEVEQFLAEVNQPFTEWEEKYGDAARGTGKYMYIALICFILMLLFCFFICWIAAKQQEAAAAQKEYIEKAKVIIRDKSGPWIEKGLCWNTSAEFPRWIEMWTSIGGGGAPPSQMPRAEAELKNNYNQNIYGQDNSHNV